MKFAKNKTDIVILQESWMKDENITISHSSFICIKSNVQNTHVRVLIFVAKNAKKFTCTSRSDIVNSKDMQAISIMNNKIQRKILLFNVYNEKSQNADDEQLYMIERELAKVMLNSEQKVIIIKDFNAHHSWWNAKISNSIRTKALIKWVNLHKCNLINTSDIERRSKSMMKREFINTEERIINSDSNLIDKLKSKLTWKEQVINRLQNSTKDCVLMQKSKSNSFVLEDCTENNVVSEKYSVSYQITICFIFSWCVRQ